MTGIEMIEAERERQISAEGWTFEHDDTHTNGDLALAGAAYAKAAWYQTGGVQRWPHLSFPTDWAWKPSDDPIRNLIKAGALIAAEIDRLQRRGTVEESRP